MLDWAAPWEYTAHAVRGEVVRVQSEFQEIEIVETEAYGRCLLLDGEVQSFEADEHIYHESLVHPALLLHAAPRDVLVLGGGEGATLREVLRHRSVRRAVMVDLDPHVVAAAREHLPTFHAGSFDDPRTKLRFGDGRAFVETSRERFDVVIIDVTNPMAGGPSCRLFTAEFYERVRDRLNPGGLVALQSDAVTLHGLESAAMIYRTVRSAWPHAASYAVFLPAYTTDWSFTLAGPGSVDAAAVDPTEIDARIAARVSTPLGFYDGIAHRRLFHLPRYVRDAFQKRGPVSRDARPLQEQYPGYTG
jgi:spermidine synthase